MRITNAFEESSFETIVMCSEKESEGHRWCFICREEPHVPADCEDVRKWRKKCRDDSETCNWLQANTKDCPKCRIAINKDGGCNHIHCKQCDFHFCWVCLGTFEHTTYQHSCNKFAADDSNVTSSRSALERYMHHFERFSNHLKSRELESKLREMTLLKMNEMQEKGNKTYIDVQFMQQATSQLIQSRQTLQWTYVVGFYLPPWLVKNIFEMNQGELETATERLSNMLEVLLLPHPPPLYPYLPTFPERIPPLPTLLCFFQPFRAPSVPPLPFPCLALPGLCSFAGIMRALDPMEIGALFSPPLRSPDAQVQHKYRAFPPQREAHNDKGVASSGTLSPHPSPLP